MLIKDIVNVVREFGSGSDHTGAGISVAQPLWLLPSSFFSNLVTVLSIAVEGDRLLVCLGGEGTHVGMG